MYGFTNEQVRNLQRGTRGVLAFGILASVCANVLHSLTRPEAASDPDWLIASGAALSALAPLVLFACIELVSRIPVQSRWLGGLRLLVTFAVGGFAGWVSYWHMESVAELLGEDGTAKYLYPLIIDGMMLVATISLIELGRLARTVQQIEAAAAEPTIDEERAAMLSARAKKAAATRKKNQVAKAKTTRTPRAPKATKVADEIDQIEALFDIAPVSPAPAGR